MFFIGDSCYYKAGKGIKKEKAKVIGVTYVDKNYRYILELKSNECIIENVSITKLSTY